MHKYTQQYKLCNIMYHQMNKSQTDMDKAVLLDLDKNSLQDTINMHLLLYITRLYTLYTPQLQELQRNQVGMVEVGDLLNNNNQLDRLRR